MSNIEKRQIESNNIPTISHDNLIACVTKYIRNTHTILLIGEAGVGKSAVAKEIALKLNYPLIDRRLGQLEMGDLKGLFTIGKSPDGEKNIVKLALHDWLYRATIEPCVILLDEFNRADPQVMKEAFELIYDRSLYGEKIHKDCIIIACVNPDSDHYQVVDMNDKALKRRFWRVRYQPTREEWLRWARDNLHSHIYQFVSRDENWDKYIDLKSTDESNPENSAPTRASWEKLNDALTNKNYLDEGEDLLIDRPDSHIFMHVVAGHMGQQTAAALSQFIKHDLSKISAKQIVEEYKTVKPLLWREDIDPEDSTLKTKNVLIPNDQLISLAEGVGMYLMHRKVKDNALFDNIIEFFDDLECRAEIRAKVVEMLKNMWSGVTENTESMSAEDLAKKDAKRKVLISNIQNNTQGTVFLNRISQYINEYRNIMKTKTESTGKKRKGIVDLSA